jgi:hypothetical protein
MYSRESRRPGSRQGQGRCAAVLLAAALGLLVCLAVVPPPARSADRQGSQPKGSGKAPAVPAKKAEKPAAAVGTGASHEGSGEASAPKPKGPPVARRVEKKAEKWDQEHAGNEYRSLELELALAKAEKLYLVFDTAQRRLELRLKGAVVWDCRVEIAPEDSGDLDRFVARFRGPDHAAVRLVSDRYLFAGAEKTPDSILAIVGQVVKADPITLQRELPERFQLFWGWGLVLDVHTEITGLPTSKFHNNRLSLIEAIRRPFGEVMLEVRVTPEAALTLYRAASPGLPTLLDPYP